MFTVHNFIEYEGLPKKKKKGNYAKKLLGNVLQNAVYIFGERKGKVSE
jgi:hypothetical protein